MAMRNFFNLKTVQLWNLSSRKYQPLRADNAVGRVFSAEKIVTYGRSRFASARKIHARHEWSDYRRFGRILLDNGLNDKRYTYDVGALTQFPKSYNEHLGHSVKPRTLGLSPLFTYYVNPLSMIQFATKYVLSSRFFFIYMARTTFQAVRPLLAFCVFGEIMKLILANISGAVPSFLFSFVMAFEVLYFFLQCYISYTFLTMFFTVMF